MTTCIERIEAAKTKTDRTRRRLENAEAALSNAAAELEAARRDFWELVGTPPALGSPLISRLERMLDRKRRHYNSADVLTAAGISVLSGVFFGMFFGATILTAIAFSALAIAAVLYMKAARVGYFQRKKEVE